MVVPGWNTIRCTTRCAPDHGHAALTETVKNPVPPGETRHRIHPASLPDIGRCDMPRPDAAPHAGRPASIGPPVPTLTTGLPTALRNGTCDHGSVPSEPHLTMIQNAIARFASQSTTIKGWSITVTAALLGFGATTTTPVVAVVAGYATLAFAALDAYYLSLERAYRKLYDSAVADHAEPWSLSVTRPAARAILSALRSFAIVVTYGTSLAAAATIGGYLALS